MLSNRNQFYAPLLFIADMLATSAALILAYYARFSTGWVPITKGVPELSLYLTLLPAVCAISAIVFASFGMYRETRLTAGFRELLTILKVVTLAFLIIMAIANMFKPYKFSRLVWIYFWLADIGLIWAGRSLFGFILQKMRRRGVDVMNVLIIGAGRLACEVAERIKSKPELGINIVGYVSRHKDKVGTCVAGEEVLGDFDRLDDLIAEHGVKTVIVALPLDAHQRVADTITHLSDATVNVMIVPDLFQFVTLHGGVEEFEGLPILHIQDTPLYGWNRVIKRATDIIFSGLILILISPILVAIALGVKLSSPGPITYRQERMGLDGNCFKMYKFRSMRIDAEKETGAVWAAKDDPRRTRFGSFIRRFSLDELPQFFNVLKGDMSVVGPRPERPVFIDDFRKKIPKYMLRHKVKAGITGWAQINGYRGNTSLQRRIEYDLYYIENWSFMFDLKIIALTAWRVFFDKNAY